MRRILSVWLPGLTLERVFSAGEFPSDTPLAVVMSERGALRLLCSTASALVSGMALADARALVPTLLTRPADPEADRQALALLARLCGRFSPWVAIEGCDDRGGGGLWLDITGCAHLFGGEAELLAALHRQCHAAGHGVRLGLADSKGAAWALARFCATSETPAILAPGADPHPRLAPLPLAALRLPEATIRDLARLGLRRIGDVARLPRAPLASRFATQLIERLDRAFGRLPEPVAPALPPPDFVVQRRFADPLWLQAQIEAATAALLDTLCARLQAARRGARRLQLELVRVDGQRICRTIGTARPRHDAAHLAGLFAQKWQGLDAGFGFELLRLQALHTDPLIAHQPGLDDPAAADHGVVSLLDRLRARLGTGALWGWGLQESHLPERVVRPCPPLAAPPKAPWPRGRPVRLLPRPVALRTEGPAPDRFYWQGRAHRIAHRSGPERVSAEWWRADSPTRDYYRIEDTAGDRFWLFCHPDGTWFLHGFFA